MIYVRNGGCRWAKGDFLQDSGQLFQGNNFSLGLVPHGLFLELFSVDVGVSLATWFLWDLLGH